MGDGGPGEIADARLLRVSALLLAIGAGCVLVTLPVIQPPETSADLLVFFDEIYQLGPNLWLLSNLALIGGTVAITGGFILFGLTFVSGTGLILVRIGVITAVIGAVLVTATGALNGLVLGQAVEQLFGGADGSADGLFETAQTVWWVGRGLFVMSVIIFFGVTYLLFGIAVSDDPRFPARLGHVAVVSGIAGIALGVMIAVTTPIPEFERALYPLVVIVSMLWTLGLALQSWEHATATDPEGDLF